MHRTLAPSVHKHLNERNKMATTMPDTSSSDSDSDSSPEEVTVKKTKIDTSSKSTKDKESSDSEEKIDNSNDELSAVKEEMAHMSFGELQKLKNKLGSKIYNEALFGKKRKNAEKKTFKRENKNRPTEMSSKRPVGRLREVVQTKKMLSRDPRFDDLSGEYNETLFKKAYSFIDDVKVREKQKLIKKLQREKDPDKKKRIEFLIAHMNQQQKAAIEKAKAQYREKERKVKEKKLVKEGKKPFYLKKSDQKTLDLAEKYRELQKNKSLEKYISKKRKKNASKDRRNLPNRHTKF